MKTDLDRYTEEIKRRIDDNGGEVESIDVEPKSLGTVLATIKLAGEDEQRQGAFSVQELEESIGSRSPVGGSYDDREV